MRSQIAALVRKQSTRESAECTGLRAMMTPSAESTSMVGEDVEEDLD